MKLRHIFCKTDYVSEWARMMHWEFYRSSRFICYYLVRRIRQYKFETDGTFKTIEIRLGSDAPCRIVLEDVLQVHLPIDEKRYESVRDTTIIHIILRFYEKDLKRQANLSIFL